MKKLVSLMLCAVVLFSCCVCQSGAVSEEDFVPYVVDFSLISPTFEGDNRAGESRVSGLIMSYALDLSVSGTTLKIYAETYCIGDVVKSGFKNLVVQRKTAGSSSWSDYYNYGDLYKDSYASFLSTSLVVPPGYQYRISCKHYAKKSLLLTENISNTSNIVSV